MEIQRFNIPKLPRSKYWTNYTNYVSGVSKSNNNSSSSVELYDGLDSTSTEVALTANQGKVLNEKIEEHKTDVTNNYLKRADAFDSFLSKNDDDTALGKITFDSGLVSNAPIYYGCNSETENRGIAGYYVDNAYEFVSDNLSARGYLGVGNEIWFTNGIYSNYSPLSDKFKLYRDAAHKWTMELDNINVRGKLDVQTLEVEESRWIGGKLYCTMAGITVSKVETFDSYYRVYFINEKDGITIHNKFQVQDLAYCQTFNNNKVKKYWYKVIAVQPNYINLSRTNCLANSDAPEIGDDIIQLGNLRDRKRRGALVLSPDGLEVYEDIKTFVMPSPKIVLAPNGTKIDADSINFLGQTIINNNFKVDNEGNIELNGKITADKGYFRGFITNGITKITPENITKMLTYEGGTFHFNLNDLSTVIIFEGDFTNTIGGPNWDTVDWKHNMQIDLPSIAVEGMKDQSSYNRTWTVDEARAFIGHSITIYNMATSLTPKFKGLFPNEFNPKSEAQWKTITTKKGYVYHLTSNLNIWDDTNFNIDGTDSKFKYKEEIYWTCKQGHYAVGLK